MKKGTMYQVFDHSHRLLLVLKAGSPLGQQDAGALGQQLVSATSAEVQVYQSDICQTAILLLETKLFYSITMNQKI